MSSLKQQHGQQPSMQSLNVSDRSIKTVLIFNLAKIMYLEVLASPQTISGAFPEGKQPHLSIIQDLTL